MYGQLDRLPSGVREYSLTLYRTTFNDLHVERDIMDENDPEVIDYLESQYDELVDSTRPTVEEIYGSITDIEYDGEVVDGTGRDPATIRSMIYDGSTATPVHGRVKGVPPVGWEVARVHRGSLDKKSYADLIQVLRDTGIVNVRGDISRPIKIFVPEDYEEYEISVILDILYLMKHSGAVVELRSRFRMGD